MLSESSRGWDQMDSMPDCEAKICTPAELVTQFDGIAICAPMVRYSKLPFRQLCSLYDVHITHTPMILAKEFSRSAFARDCDFSTNIDERGIFYLNPIPASTADIDFRPRKTSHKTKVRGCLIAQFAANDAVHLANAAELISPYIDAIDINLGCPQNWAYQEGICSALLRQPETVRDLIRGTKARLGQSFPVHVKIRVDDDLKHTYTLINTSIQAGADLITVHGRTRHQSSAGTPVNLEAIKFAREFSRGAVPLIANGDVFTLEEAEKTRRECGVNGVMSARGLLANPALFSGYAQTPTEAVRRFVDISMQTGLLFPLFHRHCFYMLESSFNTRSERVHFNSLASHAAVIDFMRERQLV